MFSKPRPIHGRGQYKGEANTCFLVCIKNTDLFKHGVAYIQEMTIINSTAFIYLMYLIQDSGLDE